MATTAIDSGIESLVKNQRQFFESGATRDIKTRIEQLKLLKKAILQNEQAIYDALKADFNKPVFETYTSEIGVVLEEIGIMLSNIKKWSAPQQVGTGIANFPARSYIYAEPFGVSLVIGAWNYPFQLTIAPVVGAIAAGNTVIMKPSRVAAHTYEVIANMVKEFFDPRYIACADIQTDNAEMLAQRYDYIFFTGGVQVGKVIARAAAEFLTPTTLELGGKSPCIVDETADIATSAKRIVWGKFINAGQTCVAPDYLLVHEKVKDKLFDAMKAAVKEFYGENPMTSSDYASIINDRHFERLSSMIKGGKVVFGGKTDAAKKYIAPTLITDIDLDHPLMDDEIFGPILPAFSFSHFNDALRIVKKFEKPLAFYIFSNHYETQQRCIEEVQFGGGCINDTVSHFINHDLPFGGIGNSGMGGYHGKFSFDTFTHYKGVMNKVNWPDVPLRYPPYIGKLGIIKQIIK
jgi:aldehyde dehydrogenase (NAD+)